MEAEGIGITGLGAGPGLERGDFIATDDVPSMGLLTEDFICVRFGCDRGGGDRTLPASGFERWTVRLGSGSGTREPEA